MHRPLGEWHSHRNQRLILRQGKFGSGVADDRVLRALQERKVHNGYCHDGRKIYREQQLSIAGQSLYGYRTRARGWSWDLPWPRGDVVVALEKPRAGLIGRGDSSRSQSYLTLRLPPARSCAIGPREAGVHEVKGPCFSQSLPVLSGPLRNKPWPQVPISTLWQVSGA